MMLITVERKKNAIQCVNYQDTLSLLETCSEGIEGGDEEEEADELFCDVGCV